MAKEAIEAVLAAEETAREIIEEARREASDIVQAATGEAQEIIGQNRQRVLDQEQRLATEAEQAGLQAGEPALSKAQAEASVYKNLTDRDLEPLVQSLVERVVNYGNR